MRTSPLHPRVGMLATVRNRRGPIVSPASLRTQWRQEMRDKFSLTFDRGETFALQKRLGLDANRWRTFPRIIASYHYLRQPDVLSRFLATCQTSGPIDPGTEAVNTGASATASGGAP